MKTIAHSFFPSCFILYVFFAMVSMANGQQPTSPLVQSFANYQKMRAVTEFGFDWVNVSPVVNSARVEAVQLDASRPGHLYVAFGSGNLWKSTNNGINWRPIFNDQASYGIGDFALAPSNPEIIYLGTGESLKKARNFTIPGTGIYRSDDGGEHWRHLGLSDSWHIGEIAVHPTNPEIVVVSVLGHLWSENSNRGIYRTDNGGETWEHVLFVNERTGANDIVWAKNDPDVLYASMWENYPSVNGVGSGVYRSADAGVTWNRCEGGLPTGESIGRIGVAVSQTDAKKVYALVDHRGRIKEGAAQVFKSSDGGTTWSRTHEDELMIFSRIGWYFADIYVNPRDDEEIFCLGVRVAHSSDGGKSFNLLGGQVKHLTPSAASGLHLDHCELWIDPNNPNHLVLGNDGGLYQSYDKGKSWLHLNNLPTGEFYDVAVDQSEPYRIFAGAQDNATVYGSATELGQARTENWKYLWIDPWNGGDGCITQVDPNDSNTVYFSAQEGAFRRKDMKRNRSKWIRPSLPKTHGGELDFNFVAPLIISPHDSNVVYLGGNYLFKSTNRGDAWEVVSGDLSKSSDLKRESTAIASIAQSKENASLIYVGTDKGGFWVSQNGGETWEERIEGLPRGYIRSIVPSKFSSDRVYAAISGLNDDDLKTYLMCSEDRGQHWRSIAGNLFDEPANVLIEDPVYENLLYAGTFRGVYCSTNRGKSWQLMGRNFPACSVADLVIQERENDLIVATHGRGVYKLGLDVMHEKLARDSAELDSDVVFDIPDVTLPYLSDVRPGVNFRDGEKATISFWLKQAAKVEITIQGEGKTLAIFVQNANRGINQFRWNLVTESTESTLPYFINYKSFLKPGEYQVRIKRVGHPDLEAMLRVDEK
ncbi:MAG: WD40/YVTN/BNR-like repeat-containing protein [Mariniblastus sp.]